MSNFAERMEREELAGTGIEVFDTPWYDRAAGAIKVIELMAGRRIAADADVYGMGLRPLPPGFSALRTTLKAEIDPEAWATLNSDTSRAFEKPKKGRIAVKVINHLGDEVMKVFRVA